MSLFQRRKSAECSAILDIISMIICENNCYTEGG